MSELAVARALSYELNWKILNLLAGRELSATEIRMRLHVPAASVRGSIKKLIDAGMVTVQNKTLASRNRVRTYGLTGITRSVGFPPRDYLYLSESMINSLRASLGEEGARTLLQDIGIRIGENAAQSLASRTGQTGWDPPTYSKHFVAGLLAEMGFNPEIVKLEKRRLVYCERNCLFEDLAAKYPGLVCDVLDNAVHQGIDKMAGTQTTRLMCKGHGDPVCQYSVKWSAGTTKRPSI
jgi:predicted ArsR family transcriptional regulator